MGNTSSVKVDQPVDGKSTTGDVTDRYGGAAIGKYVIVTGGNSGIGLETARSLAKNGSIVTVASRSAKNGEEAVSTIKAEFPGAHVNSMVLDLTSFASICKFAADYKATGKPIHLLINNAGVMACPKTITSEGLELQFGTNHIGHFLLTTLLLDVIKTSGTSREPARIVNVSSVANYFAPSCGIVFEDLKADKSYSRFERYGSSKLANILFTKQLQRRFAAESANVVAVSLHPGIIGETKIMRHVSFGAMMGIMGFLLTSGWDRFSLAVKGEPSKTIPQGAATTVYCALCPEVLMHSGEHFSDCKVETVAVHRTAYDVKLAEKLWTVSEGIVNK